MSKTPTGKKVRTWLCEPMSKEIRKSINKIAYAEDVQHVAVMPDVHLGKEVCIGTVVATNSLIYPAAIGGDIGCGMAVVRFNCPADILKDKQAAAAVLGGLNREIPIYRHSAATMLSSLPEPLATEPLSCQQLEKQKQRDARVQFGTLGRGNHFLEFQADQNDNLWLMVHSGSRGIGQLITSHHIAHALFSSKGLKAFEAESESGKAYRNDVVWATRYAAANRLKMIEAAGKLIHRLFNVEIDWSSLIHTNHNHVRHEKHFGKHFWVHRKGAQSAFGEEPGIIPGSMGTASFHVTGRGCEEALCSCSHGAGRRLSRTQALHVVKINQLQYQMKAVFYDQRRSNKLRDEAPTAYKNIFHVMNAQKKLIRVSRELHPLLSYKGI